MLKDPHYHVQLSPISFPFLGRHWWPCGPNGVPIPPSSSGPSMAWGASLSSF